MESSAAIEIQSFCVGGRLNMVGSRAQLCCEIGDGGTAVTGVQCPFATTVRIVSQLLSLGGTPAINAAHWQRPHLRSVNVACTS